MQTGSSRGGAAILGQFWRTNKLMTLFWLSNIVIAVFGTIGIFADSRLVLGQPVWAKTTKFAFSFVLYAPTMLWMFGMIKDRPRLRRFVLDGSAILLGIEIVLLLTQAIRGRAMHFNVATPLDATLWSIMGATIFIFYAINIVGFIVLLRRKLIADRAWALSIRLGMAIMLIGFGLGFLMTNPTADQLAGMDAGVAPTFVGAHTVGAADAGPGLRFFGWSTEHGDLRIAHFIGIHGAQALALFGWFLFALSQRPGNQLGLRHRLALIWGAGAAYLGLVGLVAWQALRGQALLAPDGLTLAALGALALASAGFAAAVVFNARAGRAGTAASAGTLPG